MSLSKEARIGLLVTISLVIFFIGFYFLKGADIFSNEREYYCYYNNVDGLLNSANVQIKGLNVGHVAHMQLENGKGVRVSIMVDKSIALPEGSVASLQSVSAQLHDVMTKINNGEGSLGKMVNDKALYDNLTKSLHSLDSLMGDVNAHPHRYINVAIFGGKKKD